MSLMQIVMSHCTHNSFPRHLCIYLFFCWQTSHWFSLNEPISDLYHRIPPATIFKNVCSRVKDIIIHHVSCTEERPNRAFMWHLCWQTSLWFFKAFAHSPQRFLLSVGVAFSPPGDWWKCQRSANFPNVSTPCDKSNASCNASAIQRQTYQLLIFACVLFLPNFWGALDVLRVPL